MTYDALIVGFGPVGATMANLLARRGLRVAVIDAERHIYDKPRALTFDHEAMRVFQACALAHRIAEFTAPHRGTHYIGVDGRVIKKFDPQPPPYPLGWSPTITFVQPELERLLRQGATEAGVDVFLGHLGLGFEQDEDGIALAVGDIARGEELVLRARALLGCDGANSFVRKQLDIATEDLGFDEWWMVVDTLIRRPIDLPPRSIQYCWPSRPSSFIPGPGRLRRWEIKLLPGEDPKEFGQPENVIRQIARFADPACLEVWRSAVYRFHAVVAQRWRNGRVFLLGDACHQTPPFLGQGMCAGIRDAANLAWKLAMVLQNGAHEALLDTYEEERKPHVRKLVATAKEFGLIIGELDPDAARVRDEVLRGQLERGEAETIRQRYVPDLTGGVIDRGRRGQASGALFVQPMVRDAAGAEILLDDLLRFRFLIATATVRTQAWLTRESRQLWRRLGGERIVIAESEHEQSDDSSADDDIRRVVQADGLFRTWMSQHSCAAAVVRPDRYVFGIANDAGELNHLISALGRQVLG